jgi:hypothetical protein
VAQASDRGLALRRFGLPLSYHEFELYLGGRDLYRRIIADGLDNNLIHLHLASNAELALDAYFRNNAVDVHRAFARYWMEFVCRFDDRGDEDAVPNAPFAAVGPVADRAVTTVVNPAQWALDRHAAAGRRVMRFPLGTPLPRKTFLLFDLEESAGRIEFTIDSERGVVRVSFDLEVARRARPQRWHNVCSVGIESRAAGLRGIEVAGTDAGTRWRCTSVLRA